MEGVKAVEYRMSFAIQLLAGGEHLTTVFDPCILRSLVRLEYFREIGIVYPLDDSVYRILGSKFTVGFRDNAGRFGWEVDVARGESESQGPIPYLRG